MLLAALIIHYIQHYTVYSSLILTQKKNVNLNKKCKLEFFLSQSCFYFGWTIHDTDCHYSRYILLHFCMYHTPLDPNYFCVTYWVDSHFQSKSRDQGTTVCSEHPTCQICVYSSTNRAWPSPIQNVYVCVLLLDLMNCGSGLWQIELHHLECNELPATSLLDDICV